MEKLERINKYLSETGVCSRRETDDLIADGRVEVNGVAARVGQIIDTEKDIVTVDGQKVNPNDPMGNAISKESYEKTHRTPWWVEHNEEKADRLEEKRQNPKSKLVRHDPQGKKFVKVPKSQLTPAELEAREAKREENRKPKTFSEALSDKQKLMNVKVRRVEGVNPKAKAQRPGATKRKKK